MITFEMISDMRHDVRDLLVSELRLTEQQAIELAEDIVDKICQYFDK